MIKLHPFITYSTAKAPKINPNSFCNTFIIVLFRNFIKKFEKIIIIEVKNNLNTEWKNLSIKTNHCVVDIL